MSNDLIIIIYPPLSEPLGGLGFGFLILFVAGGIYFKELFYRGEKYSLFQYLKNFSNKSALILVIYLLFTFYMGLTKFNLIPRLYSSEFPQGYIQLINDAESGNESSVAGKYRHDAYKEQMDKFIRRHKESEK